MGMKRARQPEYNEFQREEERNPSSRNLEPKDSWTVKSVPQQHKVDRNESTRHMATLLMPTEQASNIIADSHTELNVAYGCLFVPVVFAAWWYWTRRGARKFVRKLMLTTSNMRSPSCDSAAIDNSMADDTSHAPPTRASSSDQFRSWNDVVEQESPDMSVRFVRWIKGNHSASGKRQMNAVSKRTLRQRMQRNLPSQQQDDKALPILSQVLSGGEDSCLSDSYSNARSVAWEYIQDVSAIEICATTSDLIEGAIELSNTSTSM